MQVIDRMPEADPIVGRPVAAAVSPDPATIVLPPRAMDHRLGRVLERRLSFLIPLAAGVPVATILVLHYHSIYADALSRLANGYYVLYSRDPHLAAIGFVWNPLPSLADIPLLAFKGLWVPLSRDAFASNLVSCVFYALSCWQLYRYLEDLSLNRVLRWGLWLCFAANPLIFFYGVNGMSESLFIFTLIVTARYLGRWLEQGDTRSLVISAVALGVAYIDRNEAIAAAFAAGLTVVAVSYVRAIGERSYRRRVALTDGSIYLSPFVLSFGAWAFTSWVIVGHPFEQFSSQYGNAAQIKAAGSQIFQHTAVGRFAYAVHGVETVAPFLVVIILLAVARLLLSRDFRALAPMAVLLSVLAFEVLAYTNRQIFPWYRYYIYACPAIVMTAACLAAQTRIDLTRDEWLTRRRMARLHVKTRRRGQAVVAALSLLMAAVGGVTTALTLGHYSELSASDRYQLAYILWPEAHDAKGNKLYPAYSGLRDLALQLDSMHLAVGSLMVDNFTSCIPELILDSTHPKQFVIPNDEDYQEKFGVPYQFGVRFFLVPDPATNPTDALNQHLPGLFSSGQGLATMVREIHVSGCPAFRLYKALPSST